MKTTTFNVVLYKGIKPSLGVRIGAHSLVELKETLKDFFGSEQAYDVYIAQRQYEVREEDKWPNCTCTGVKSVLLYQNNGGNDGY